jgi:galactose dehydrogenase
MMPSAIYPDLNGRSVLITGGGTGIGAALTEGFLRQGCKVAFVDIADAPSNALVERLKREVGVAPLYLKADLTDIEALKAGCSKAAETNGPVTVLVNNAALDDRHQLADVTSDYWDRNQAVNLKPHMFTAQAVAPGMRAAGFGSIINFTSTSFLINHPDMPSYTAAKAGIIGLTKGLAGHLGRDGIRVNAVAPGWVMTERQQKLWATGEGVEAHIAKQSIKEAMQPDDMVGICLYLASDGAKMLTAQTIIVDGGFL